MVFAEHMLTLHKKLKAEDETQGVLFTVHDEAIPEINIPEVPEHLVKTIEDIFSQEPTWMPGLPLKAECKIRTRYFK